MRFKTFLLKFHYSIANEIIKEVKVVRVYKMIRSSIFTCQANDAVLLAKSENDLHRLVYKFNEAC